MIAHDRASQRAAEVVLFESGGWLRRANTGQVLFGCQVWRPEKLEDVTVNLVGSGLGLNGNDTAGSVAKFRVVRCGDNFEFLHRVDVGRDRYVLGPVGGGLDAIQLDRVAELALPAY